MSASIVLEKREESPRIRYFRKRPKASQGGKDVKGFFLLFWPSASPLGHRPPKSGRPAPNSPISLFSAFGFQPELTETARCRAKNPAVIENTYTTGLSGCRKKGCRGKGYHVVEFASQCRRERLDDGQVRVAALHVHAVSQPASAGFAERYSNLRRAQSLRHSALS